MSIAHSIAERLRHARGKTTQVEAAKRLGIHTNTLGKYERGQRVPDALYLVSFCLEFSVNPSWLLLGIGNINTNEFTKGTPPLSSQMDTAEKLVLDLMESENIPLEQGQFDAVVHILRTDILTKTKTILALSKSSHKNHSVLIAYPTTFVRNAYDRFIYLFDWGEEGTHAWLLANYGVHYIDEALMPIEKIAGHLYDIYADRFGEKEAEEIARKHKCTVMEYIEDDSGNPFTIDQYIELRKKRWEIQRDEERKKFEEEQLRRGYTLEEQEKINYIKEQIEESRKKSNEQKE